MRQSPPRQNFPKAAFSSPLNVGSAFAGGSASPSGGGKAIGQNGSNAKSANAPTHIAFAKSTPATGTGNFFFGSGYGGAGSSPGVFGQQPQGAQADGQRGPPMRQGPLYGALEALQAATKSLNQADDQNAQAGRLDQEIRHRRNIAANSLSPEEVWQSIPSGGEAAWKSSNTRQPARLRVARLQEALSEAASGLQRATEACRGGGEDDVSSANLGAASLGPPGATVALRNECAALEAESKELEEEKAFLDARMVEVQTELARLKEQASPMRRTMISDDDGKGETPEAENLPEPSRAKGATSEDVSELAVVLRLLACLKDLAINNRSVILPTDPSRWSREQQVVAYFLDEVEACQTAGTY